MGVELKVTGIEETVKKLEALKVKAQVKIIKAAVDDFATAIAAEIAAKAPRRTGALKGSIKVASGIRRTRENIKARIVGEFYSRFLEHGTKYIDAESHKFIAPVLEDKGGQLLEQMLKKIADEVSEG